MARTPNYLKAAFLLPANLMGLLTAAASSALTQEPLPALVALGLEGLFLGAASSSKRFQRAVRAWQQSESPDWGAIAAATGYYDQSHLITEFKALTGVTPRALVLPRAGRQGAARPPMAGNRS